MKKLNLLIGVAKMIFALAISGSLFSSCATIIGGSKYYAHVTVGNHPNANIYYVGNIQGKGYAAFKVPRVEANTFSVTIKEENCDNQKFDFKQRSFRGWALVGTIVTWTGTINGIPLPWGIAVDVASGALWKPDITEKGVTKTDYKHFNYFINYTGCKQDDTNKAVIKTKTERLIELKELLDKAVLNQEEFNI